jgi:hypothetical protein
LIENFLGMTREKPLSAIQFPIILKRVSGVSGFGSFVPLSPQKIKKHSNASVTAENPILFFM